MGTVNQVILVGYLGADAQLRSTSGGTSILNATVATTSTWKDKNTHERTEKTEWTRICYFGRGAEAVAPYMKKGTLVYVRGRLETREWTNKEDQKVKTTEVRVDDLTLLGGRTRDEHDQRRDPVGAAPGSATDLDDDIPF